MFRQKITRILLLAVAVIAVAGIGSAAQTSRKSTTHKKTRRTALRRKSSVSKRSGPAALTARTYRRSSRMRRARWTQWSVPTYADSTVGDRIDGDDLVVRRAAVDALGPYNGTVVAVDPDTGRVLTMVNQRVALASGFQPCSTVKIPVALAALSEGLIDKNTSVRLYGRKTMQLTEALAHSNNQYFANLGLKLGYERFTHYARLFGLGDKAGLNIAGEEPGVYPDAPPKDGGMGMMTSFGTGITFTPLELAALVSAVANGGTLYWLQYPTSQEELDQFVPRVKRHLDIANLIPQIRPGMAGAVEFGTARRAVYNPETPVCGKTGTCTGGTTHLGWFGSFSDFGDRKLALIVLLTGGYGVSGPTAAEITGNIYRKLIDQGYFRKQPVLTPALLVPR